MDTRFAISEYNDAVAVNKELDELIKKPIYTIKPEALKKYEDEYYNKKCLKSKAQIEEARQIIPGGVQHNLAFNYPFPLVFTQAEFVASLAIRTAISMTLTAISISTSFRQAVRLFSAPTRKLFVSRSLTSLILAVPQPDFSTSLSTSSPKRFPTALKPLICSV